MTSVEQLDYVAKYFSLPGVQAVGRVAHLTDLYLAIVYPAAIGRSGAYVLFDNKHNPTTYNQNKGLDLNHDGKVTVAEVAQILNAQLQAGLTSGNVFEMNSYYA
jgi:hypothetical protein